MSDLVPIRPPAGYPQPPELRPVWVDLDRLFPAPAGTSRTAVPNGVEVTGTAPGLLHAWRRGGTGIWLGEVTIELAWVDGRPGRWRLERQWVPSWVLRPRDDD